MIHVNFYERVWISIAVVAIAIMFVAVAAAGFSFGVQMPGAMGMVNPAKLGEDAVFANPGVFDKGEGKVEVVMVAQTWKFNPAKIEIPAGSEVTFKVTSRDVTHGLMVLNTNINVMVVPGQVTEFTVKLTEPGTYTFVCHEYCGVAHQTMTGEITVIP
jgi:cytochrome c oxidase subunit II